MDVFLGEKKEKKGSNKLIIGSILIAVVLIVGAFGAITLIPSSKVVRKDALEGAYFEGSPEFQAYTKEIIITTDPNRLLEAKTGMGKITMYIGGSIRNKGERDLSTLQVAVAVVNLKQEIVKEKKYVIVPKMRKILGAGTTVNLSVTLGGFSPDDDRANVRWKVTALKFVE